MTSPERAHEGWLSSVLGSAAFARAYSVTVIGAVFSSFLIERTVGRVTYVTIIGCLCILGAGMLVARRREISFVRLLPTTLLLFIGWTFASVFWATDRGVSFWSWMSTAAIAFLAVTIGHVRDTLQTARAFGDVLRVLLGVSLGLELLSGVILDTPLRFLGIQGDIAQLGPVQGMFGTRNLLGFVAVIALITFLVEYRTQSVRPGVSVGSVLLAGLLAALSDSPTVLVLAVAVLLAVGALALVRHTATERRTALQWVLGVVVVVGIVVGYLARHPIIAWLGAGSDFSMRVDLWNRMVDFVAYRPVLGWGWYGPWADELPFTWLNYYLDASHETALNAYFDVLLQIGWIGLLVFAAFVGVALVRSWLDASERRSVVYAWTPLVLVALLVGSMFESFALAGAGLLLLVICAVRAGHSRSWRERFDARGGGLPSVQDPPIASG